jgi:hypothetical protein
MSEHVSGVSQRQLQLCLERQLDGQRPMRKSWLRRRPPLHYGHLRFTIDGVLFLERVQYDIVVAVLEIVPPLAGERNWVVRGMVVDTTLRKAFDREIVNYSPCEITYDAVAQQGVYDNWDSSQFNNWNLGQIGTFAKKLR